MADRSGYDAFVEASWHRLLRTAYLLARDWGVAEDLVHTALLKAWQVWPRLEAEREAYVRKIIVNLHVSWWRRRWRQAEVTSGSPPDQAQVADHMGRADDRELVRQALGRLPARQRAVVVLRFFEDLTEAQTAPQGRSSAWAGRARTPAAPVEPPATISAGSLHLVTKGSATWPGTREVTLTVPNRGRTVAIVTYCGDGLTERLTTDVWVNGRLIKGPHGCSAPPTPRGTGFLVLGRQPRGEKTLTIRVRLEAPIPGYRQRAGTLTVAAYDGTL